MKHHREAKLELEKKLHLITTRVIKLTNDPATTTASKEMQCTNELEDLREKEIDEEDYLNLIHVIVCLWKTNQYNTFELQSTDLFAIS